MLPRRSRLRPPRVSSPQLSSRAKSGRHAASCYAPPPERRIRARTSRTRRRRLMRVSWIGVLCWRTVSCPYGAAPLGSRLPVPDRLFDHISAILARHRLGQLRDRLCKVARSSHYGIESELLHARRRIVAPAGRMRLSADGVVRERPHRRKCEHNTSGALHPSQADIGPARKGSKFRSAVVLPSCADVGTERAGCNSYRALDPRFRTIQVCSKDLSASALVMLGALLRDVRNKRSTALDAADSSVSPLPGDQNRAETHATPEQTEVGTPLRAAANRPVRRERAGHRRHAGVVRTTDGDTGSANHPDDEADPGPCRQAPDGFDEGRS
jgi:hypothetical protein